MFRTCVVVAREDEPGAKRLVAYFVTPSDELDASELREHANRKLPEYMIPTAFMFLDRFPLTPNGKIDRKALPVPSTRPAMKNNYVAPQTPVERILARLWAKVLRVDRVGVNDNFFELGGDSILSIQIISMARGEGLKLTPTLMFANQTIATASCCGGGRGPNGVGNTDCCW